MNARRGGGMVYAEDLKSLTLQWVCGFDSHPRHMEKMREILSIIWLPLSALAVLAFFYSTWGFFNFPPQEEIVAIAKGYYDEYGLLTVFFAALVEAMLLAGWYFPGSLVIVFGVVLAGGNVPRLIGMTIAVTLGFIVAHIFNYLLGKHGWYRILTALGFQEALDKAQGQLATYGPRAILLTYWHPNFATLTSTAAGILHIPFRPFLVYSVIALIVWDSLWAGLGYLLGDSAVTAIGPKVVVPFIACWIVIALTYRAWQKRRARNDPPESSQS